MADEQIDTTNKFLVGTRGEGIVFLRFALRLDLVDALRESDAPLPSSMSKPDALLLAAVDDSPQLAESRGPPVPACACTSSEISVSGSLVPLGGASGIGGSRVLHRVEGSVPRFVIACQRDDVRRWLNECSGTNCRAERFAAKVGRITAKYGYVRVEVPQ